jgi:hypothetical protein
MAARLVHALSGEREGDLAIGFAGGGRTAKRRRGTVRRSKSAAQLRDALCLKADFKGRENHENPERQRLVSAGNGR